MIIELIWPKWHKNDHMIDSKPQKPLLLFNRWAWIIKIIVHLLFGWFSWTTKVDDYMYRYWEWVASVYENPQFSTQLSDFNQTETSQIILSFFSLIALMTSSTRMNDEIYKAVTHKHPFDWTILKLRINLKLWYAFWAITFYAYTHEGTHIQCTHWTVSIFSLITYPNLWLYKYY